MAGGIDWFRWHHGSVTDPKFQLVARKAGASLSDVLAVWAYLLEQASASEQRGSIGEIDAEALDCLFGFPSTETRTANILKAFNERGLLDGPQVSAWEKRQPKRERDTDNSAERTRAYRERLKTPTKATASHVTPSDASDDQKNARGEERRVENKYTEPKGSGGKPPTNEEIIFSYGLSLLTSAGSTDKAARSFLGGLRKGRDDVEVVNALRDCIRAKPLQPLEWLAAALPPAGAKSKPNAQEALEAQNREVGRRFLEKEAMNAPQ